MQTEYQGVEAACNSPAANLSGCSLSRAAHSGRRPAEQMALPRRNAFWASWVMASASSSITNLKPFLEDKQGGQKGSRFNNSSCSCELLIKGNSFLSRRYVTSVDGFLVLLEDGPGAGKAQNGTSYNINTSVI